ncbi:MAG: hypothetical protein NTU83_05125 [Candidatus Hydrogenedentes bacterium]|nr:hypothetical protein [Candidatus Hydrogenedentota bacterium]
MIAWGSTWETVVRVLLEMPLLGRLLVGSIELAVLAGAVWLGIAAFRLRSPRLVALLWFVVLLKPLSVLVVGSPLPLMIIETPQTESNRAAMRDIQIPSPVPVVPAPVSEALSQPVNAAEATYLEQQNRAIAAGLAVSDVIFKIRDSQPVLPPATHSAGRTVAYAVTGAWACGIVLFLLWAVSIPPMRGRPPHADVPAAACDGTVRIAGHRGRDSPRDPVTKMAGGRSVEHEDVLGAPP